MASLEGTKTDRQALTGNIRVKHGVDGESVTISNITESAEDGGTNTVEFSDGSTLKIKNGSSGKNGKDGANGADGKDGKSAYQYAQDGGYTGTEEEFAQKLAQENIQLAKNLTTTEEGFALDATQGKILQDAIDEQNKNSKKVDTLFLGNLEIDTQGVVNLSGNADEYDTMEIHYWDKDGRFHIKNLKYGYSTPDVSFNPWSDSAISVLTAFFSCYNSNKIDIIRIKEFQLNVGSHTTYTGNTKITVFAVYGIKYPEQ